MEATQQATGPVFKDARQAFRDAIAAGRLSDVDGQQHYAGEYMYMGTYNGKDQFKNILTRLYID